MRFPIADGVLGGADAERIVVAVLFAAAIVGLLALRVKARGLPKGPGRWRR